MLKSVFWVAYFHLDLSHVLQGHAKAEDLEILILFVIGQGFARIDQFDQHGNMRKRPHMHMNTHLTPQLLAVVEYLCV